MNDSSDCQQEAARDGNDSACDLWPMRLLDALPDWLRHMLVNGMIAALLALSMVLFTTSGSMGWGIVTMASASLVVALSVVGVAFLPLSRLRSVSLKRFLITWLVLAVSLLIWGPFFAYFGSFPLVLVARMIGSESPSQSQCFMLLLDNIPEVAFGVFVALQTCTWIKPLGKFVGWR